MRHNDIATARNPELIVCSIDYDGCISGRHAGDGAENMRLHLRNLVIQNPQANLVLMVGSARQSIFSDLHHELANRNGSCWVFLKSFLLDFQSSFPDLADRVSLDPFLLEDIFCEKNPGHHFDLRVNASSEVLKDMYDDRKRHSMHGLDIHWQDTTKISLIYAQLHYIGMKHPGKKIAFHFYDDWDYVLDALRKWYKLQIELIPNNFSLCLFQYVDGNFIKSPFNIDGVGFVDCDYSNNVKELHSSDWLGLNRTNIANRILDEPNIVLAIHLFHSSRDKNGFIHRLRERWECAVFDFLDRIDIWPSEKTMIVEWWLLDAVRLKNIAFIERCVQYVDPNVCVEYFINALENNDNELATVLSPILDSPDLGEFSRNDINILLFKKKKYDWLEKQYGYLVDWCRNTNHDGLKKSGLKDLLVKHFIEYQALPLLIDLKRFCYHLSSLKGDELTAENCVALHAVVLAYAHDNRCFEERLLSTIILSQLTIDLAVNPEDSAGAPAFNSLIFNKTPGEARVSGDAGVAMSASGAASSAAGTGSDARVSPRAGIAEDSERMRQKYLNASTAVYPSEIQKIMIEKIQALSLNETNNALQSAYRILRFVILSASLPSENVLGTLYEMIRYWKNAESIIPGKTHLQLLIEQDRALQIEASSRPRSVSSFFCCCCDRNAVFSHEEFVGSLPIVAVRNAAASKIERQVPSKYALSL